MDDESPRSGRCAIIGRPNVGKSTLLNALLGQKLAITTAKPQTTRTSLLGVLMVPEPPTQLAFVDTPGWHDPAGALGRALVESAKGSMESADVLVLVVEVPVRAASSSPLTRQDLMVLEAAKATGRPLVLAINKIDRARDKRRLLPMLEQCARLHPFAALVPLAARSGKNVAQLVGALREHLLPGLMYDPELLTDRPERFFAAEFVREAVIEHTRQEVPYGAAVVVDEFRDEPGISHISATIVVEKASHKGIVIGQGGSLLKSIGTAARLQLEAFLERKVFLELWVKVVPGWTRDARRVREFAGDEPQ